MTRFQATHTNREIAHFHAKTWEHWRAAYDYRLAKGSYRADLKPSPTGVSLNTLFILGVTEDPRFDGLTPLCAPIHVSA